MNASLVQIGGGVERANAVPRAKWAGVRPSSAQIYVENRCHLRCKHCYESPTTHPHEQHMELADYERLFDQLAELGVLFVTFTGGEVFLRKDFLDIVAAARVRRFAVTIYTSGTLIDEAKADRLRALKVGQVDVSVYSHDAAVHDAFTRSPGSHARSVRALELLHARGVRTKMKSNVFTFNLAHLDGLIALAGSLGAEISFDPVVRKRMDGDRAPEEFAVSPDEVRRYVLARPDLAAVFRKHEPERLCSGERSILDGDDLMCGAGRDTISIGADGSVSACGFFPVAAGAWSDAASISDIWYGSAQLDQVREMTFGRMTECPTCDVRTTCSPCMAYGLVEHGSIGACNSGSRHAATALRLLAEQKARANAKMSRGRALPIVGSAAVSVPPPTGVTLDSEP